jgi:hypothetical protein
MENSTAPERQADETTEKEETLASLLSKNFEEAEKSEPDEAASQEPETPEITDAEPEEGDESTDKENQDEAAQKETETASPIEAPQHWTKEERDAFGKLPDDLKRFYTEKQKSIQADATKKWEEASTIKREFEPLKQVLEPYKGVFARDGYDPITGIQRLMNVWSDLQSNPAETIKQLAKAYNVSTDSLVDEAEAYVDPEIASLKNEVKVLRQKTENLTTSQIAEQRVQWVEDFASLKDDKGQPANPQFAELLEDMQPYIRPAATREEAFSILSNAYEKAKWANPTIRTRLVEEEAKAKLKAENDKRMAEAREKAAKARKAGHSLSSGQGSSDYKEAATGTIRELLERRFS